MGAHAYLPPSSAAQWVACAFWPTLNARYPETEESEETREGTAAHWAAAEMIGESDVVVGQVTPDGYVIDEEMIEGAKLYADDVDTYLFPAEQEHLQTGAPYRFSLEQRVQIPAVDTHNWGTPDAWLFDGHTLRLWDFKFGHGFVDAFENWQLIDYAAGVLDELGIDGLQDQNIAVVMTVVQPRNYHPDGPVRRWKVRASDLRPYINRLHNAAGAALRADPTATVGPQCKHCPGRVHCQANREAANRIADRVKGVVQEMDATALGVELRYLRRARDLIESRIAGLETEALSLMKRGERVPHFEIVNKVGRLAWTVPVEQVIALGDALGVNLRTPVEVITPTQAKKLIDPSVISAYSDKPKGAPILAETDDTAASKIFGRKEQ